MGKAWASSSTFTLSPFLTTLHPPGPLVIGVSPTANVVISPSQLPRCQTTGSKRSSESTPATASKKIKLGVEAISDDGVVKGKFHVFNWLEHAQMAHAELRSKLKPLMADFVFLKSVKAAHAKELNELGLKVTKLETALEQPPM
nr:hypothetical protein Iba_chr06cCG9630 [Ipomoea batatas]